MSFVRPWHGSRCSGRAAGGIASPRCDKSSAPGLLGSAVGPAEVLLRRGGFAPLRRDLPAARVLSDAGRARPPRAPRGRHRRPHPPLGARGDRQRHGAQDAPPRSAVATRARPSGTWRSTSRPRPSRRRRTPCSRSHPSPLGARGRRRLRARSARVSLAAPSSSGPRLFAFLGSTIGNLDDREAPAFLRRGRR